MNWAGLGRGE